MKLVTAHAVNMQVFQMTCKIHCDYRQCRPETFLSSCEIIFIDERCNSYRIENVRLDSWCTLSEVSVDFVVRFARGGLAELSSERWKMTN